MKIGIIVQARMSSERLPGKVLRKIAEKPMLDYTLERVFLAVGCDGVIVATSLEASDDPTAAFCAQRGVRCFRGPLENVAARFIGAADQEGFDAFVRVCGDSPLIDPAVITAAIEIFRDGEFDLVTNTFPRSFPKGVSVEVVRVSSFRDAYARMGEPADREHVTRYLYRNSEQFRIQNFLHRSGDRSDAQLSVDTPEDFLLATRMIGAMDRPHWEYGVDDLLRLHDALRVPTE